MGVSSVCVEEGERRSEEELGARRRSVGRSVGRSAAGAAPKVRTPHNDVGKYKRYRASPRLAGRGAHE